jgi:hypothetical protein
MKLKQHDTDIYKMLIGNEQLVKLGFLNGLIKGIKTMHFNLVTDTFNTAISENVMY